MIEQFISTIQSPGVGDVIVLMSVLLIVDFVTGVSRALRTKTFAWDQIADFLATHVAGRWLGLVVLVALAPYAEVLVAIAGIAVAAYVAESIASIGKNIGVAMDAGKPA